MSIFRNVAISAIILVLGGTVLSSSRNNINEADPDGPNKNSFVLAISMANFKDYKDYDISIWIQNNFASDLCAPFNLSSLLNTDPDKPLLNLRLLSSKTEDMYLMKKGSVAHFYNENLVDCLFYPIADGSDNSGTRFKFNIKDIFGDAVPEHDRFFFEYKYLAQEAEEILLAEMELKEIELDPKNLDYRQYTSYEMKGDTIIGNILSGMAWHKDHVEDIVPIMSSLNSSEKLTVSKLIVNH